MSKRTDCADFANALNELLTEYRSDIQDIIKKNVDNSARKLVKISKDKAPARTGKYKKNIKSKVTESTPRRYTRLWYVGGGQHRLTHLLDRGYPNRSVAVKSHERKLNSGKTVKVSNYVRSSGEHKGSGFLRESIAEVIPEFEKNIAKDIANG